MPNATLSIIRETFSASNEGRMHFGDVVSHLTKAGVESYDVDYRAHRATFYVDNDECHTLELETLPVEIGREFNVEAVCEAIRRSQSGAIKYPEFKRRSMQVGCIGYTAWIYGRHVAYFGRKGETHVERFPD